LRDLSPGTMPLVLRPAPVPPGMTAASAPTELVPYDLATLRPLPQGAVLDGRYVVRALVQNNPATNLYRAVLRDEPVETFYLITEAGELTGLGRAPALVARRHSHPNLAALVVLFDYSPYGPPRHYAVAEARQGVPLEWLAAPQPAALVFDWGVQLADALRYLHGQGLLSPGFRPADVLIKEDAAVLANLAAAHPAPDDPDERATAFGDDVTALANLLYETLTGRYATTGRGALVSSDLPLEVEAAFARALRPPAGAAPLTADAWHDLLVAAREALETASASIRIRSGRISDVGRHRQLNEDSLSAIECQVVQESVSAGIGVYAVADGMGGHAGGEIASALAIATVTESLLKRFINPQFNEDDTDPTPDQILDWLATAVQAANVRIHNERQTRGTDMGTTLVVAVLAGPRAYIANLGDSRAYLLAPKSDGGPALRQISEDHSLVQRLISLGQITPEEAKYHPYRNMIYKSLGERAEAEIDLFTERLTPGSRLLLCSDGLSGMVSDQDLGAILTAESDPQAACRRMVDQANAAGGLDNITAIAVYVEAG
jgi:protein phosphatase